MGKINVLSFEVANLIAAGEVVDRPFQTVVMVVVRLWRLEHQKNTTSATIPLCLHEWENRLHKGDNLILSSFGAGFTWGAIYVKWSY